MVSLQILDIGLKVRCVGVKDLRVRGGVQRSCDVGNLIAEILSEFRLREFRPDGLHGILNGLNDGCQVILGLLENPGVMVGL